MNLFEPVIKVESARLNQKFAHLKLGEILILEVEPNVIKKTIRKEFQVGNDMMQNKAFFKWFVIGGDWDTKYNLFQDERNFCEIIDLIEFQDDFRNSNSYNRCILELQNGIPQKGFNGLPFEKTKDIDDTFIFYLELISSMKINGYLPQKQLSNPKHDSDIGVAISSTGELFHFRTGHHRLAIAQLLNLPTVTVSVQIVHQNWLERKSNIDSSVGETSILATMREKIKEVDETSPSE
jgi:hypothetical protein